MNVVKLRRLQDAELQKRRERTRRRGPEPDIDTLIRWMDEGGCQATDGCTVDPDGRCRHGCESWLVELGMI